MSRPYPSLWLTWAIDVLHELAAPITDTNLFVLFDWSVAESTQDVMRWNNPLNTTQYAPGAVDMNDKNVKRYPSVEAGVWATVVTLTNGRYWTIVGNLRKSIPEEA